MRIAILDPAAGMSGDMTLGALLDAGVDPAWLEELPARLGFPSARVHISKVERASLTATKVDFEIPAGGSSGLTTRSHRVPSPDGASESSWR